MEAERMIVVTLNFCENFKPHEKSKSFVERWPNLPQQLLNNIPIKPIVLCKASTSVASLNYRELHLSNLVAKMHNQKFPTNKIYYQFKTLSIPFRPEYWWCPRRPWSTAFSWMFTQFDCLWRKGSDSVYRNIPHWDTTIAFKFATLSSNPNNNYKGYYLMVLAGCSNPPCVVSHLGYQNKWMKEENIFR